MDSCPRCTKQPDACGCSFEDLHEALRLSQAALREAVDTLRRAGARETANECAKALRSPERIDG